MYVIFKNVKQSVTYSRRIFTRVEYDRTDLVSYWDKVRVNWTSDII